MCSVITKSQLQRPVWTRCGCFDLNNETAGWFMHCFYREYFFVGDDAVGVQWLDIGHDVKLYASHADMIKKVADRHNANW